MRLHTLSVADFGPFPGEVHVDLDTASSEGLFLIHGPTGAGKSSLLDAVCFVLFGDVPGARRGSRRSLRSDHSSPDAIPTVTLELTCGGERYRVVRTADFERPKSRGSGMRTLPATASISRLRGGQWQVLSSRIPEVAEFVTDILGMKLDQFAKVVLLPQGEFAAFLRATPEDRRDLLERLFDIADYTAVEAWFAEERRQTATRATLAQATLGAEEARLADVLVDLSGPELPLPVGEALPDLTTLQRGLHEAAATALGAFDAASTDERRLATELEQAQARATARRRGERARAALEELRAQGEAVGVLEESLDAAERAASLEGHHEAVAAAEAARVAAEEALVSAMESLDDLAPPEAEHLTELRTAAATRDQAARALAEAASASAESQERQAELTALLSTLVEAASAGQSRVLAARQSLEQARSGVADAADAAGGLAVARLQRDGAEDRLSLLHEVLRGTDALAAARAEATDAHEEALAAREQLLALERRRLDEMAAELATALVSGDPCPVCGGTEHPAPARSTDPVTVTALGTARKRSEHLTSVHQDLAHRVAGLAATDAERRSRLGEELPSVAELEAAAVELRSSVASLEQRAAQAEPAARALAAAETAAHAADLDHERDLLSVRATEAELAAVGAELARQRRRCSTLEAAHRGCPCLLPAEPEQEPPSPLTVAERHVRFVAALEAAVDVLGAVTLATAAAAERLAALEAATAEVGFDTPGASLAAALPRDERLELAQRLTAYTASLRAAEATLGEDDVRDALDTPTEDLAGLSEEHRLARSALLTARDAQTRAEQAVSAVDRLLPRLEAARAELASAAARADQVKALADLVGGTSPDNTLKMRLTSYVLAARLEKVVALANERLGALGSGRFRLEYSDVRVSGGGRSGLGLTVLDQWTGRGRETATLSGGEAFMASLALALGLADAVREESGGLELGTLFVDEGFGALDDESLEEVLGVLDSLREGGRAVGVVSHVADLRTRIAHQVVVTKTQAGSRVSVRAAADAVA